MKKRSIIIDLAVCVILVLVAISIWYFWLANAPPVQAWIHDWLENPIGLTAIATVGAAIGTIGAVIIALYGTRNERKKAQEDRDEGRRQFLASQKQTQDALEEGRRQFLETQYAANKPLLVPDDERPQYTDASIHNVGTGIALNITVLRFTSAYGGVLSIGYIESPIPKNEFKSVIFGSGLSTRLTQNDKIGAYTLGVPEELDFKGHGERLVLTYLDIFGRKHASIFDHVSPQNAPGTQPWLSIAFLSDIPQDINEMIEARELPSPKDTKP